MRRESSFEIGEHRAIEASGVGATFNDTLSSYAFYFSIDVCFQGLGN